ncbi:type I restriction enzyme S subunit [Aminobacter lissarensis]|uniref:Type I restriction enzyme S subunit n=1 Tax=Aminobacter carboxidus TaxID=376165 RepID=A0A8E2BDI6_9HYPH|nr:hypothetical protein [Aminobacter lissarensis]MBB6465850.1 type I restriction enzyme S subunit [Aminobacter lissarensis]
MSLEEAIARRYPHSSEAGHALREGLVSLCRYHIDSGFGDATAEQRLSDEDHNVFWQQLSEVLLADQIAKAGLRLIHEAEGPDFLIEHDGMRVWVEVITPEPKGLPDAWINHVVGNVVSLPHQELLLRWTAAIKEKAQKLLGYAKRDTGDHVAGYRGKGIVGERDIYVIAVNARLLRGFGGAFPELVGISQFPYAVEATLAVGPLQVQFDRETLKEVGSGHQHRTRIRKPTGAEVPADTFLHPDFAPISAIWAVDVDEILVLGEARPMAVVHNPLATSPLPRNFLPAQSEYVATSYQDYYDVERQDGLLVQSRHAEWRKEARTVER